jgi:hypothetical protein
MSKFLSVGMCTSWGKTDCRPPGMYKAISGMKKSPTDQGELSGILQKLGYDKDQVFHLMHFAD